MSEDTKWIMSPPPEGQGQQKMTEAEIARAVDALENALAQQPIHPCEECGKPAVMRYFRDGRWRCERHFQFAFHEDFGIWPGEE